MEKDERPVAVLWPQQTRKKELALLVGMQLPFRDRLAVEESLAELARLTKTAGAQVEQIEITKCQAPAPALFIGKGKAAEIAALCQTKKINVVIFDEDLTPAQAKNLQNLFGVKVIDRTELILDIFALHASSREGKIQVELAQLQYMLPRLVHAWTHLSRQWGGVGTRGPGERQLELDRRRIRAQIAKLSRDLDRVHNHRFLQRKRRERVGVPLAALIGYTNAGKTTLFNRLTKSQLPVEDKLFTTLDPTIRKILLPNNQRVLFSDTVGFIRKLPHHLVESFKATLEEVREADLLLHVVDAGAHQIEEQYTVVLDLLKELDIIDKPLVTVVNKTDSLTNASLSNRLCRKFHSSVAVSALTGDGTEKLIAKIQGQLARLRRPVEFFIPNRCLGLVARVYKLGKVTRIDYTDTGVSIRAEMPPAGMGELREWIVNENE